MTAEPTPRIPRSIWVLTAVAFCVALGFGVVAPAIPLFAREFGVGRTAVGMAISAFAFFRFVSALSAGSLVDRFGERRILALGLLTVAATTGTAPLMSSYVGFVALRGIGGVGSAAFTVAATSLVLRLAPQEVRGRAMNRYQSGFLFGGVAGPALGGFLTEIDPAVPFFFYGGTLVVAAAVAQVGLRADDRRRASARAAVGKQGTPAPAAGWSDVRRALRHPAYVAAVVVNFGTGWTLFGVRNSLVPLYVVEDLGSTARLTGIGLLVGAAFQAVALLRAGWYTDTAGRRPAMIIGTLTATVAIAALALPGHVLAFLAAMALLGLASALLGSAPSATVGDLSPQGGGRLVAAFQMASDVGAVIGPLAAGALADSFGSHVAFAATAVVLAAGVLAGVLMPETGSPRRDWLTRVRPVRPGTSEPVDG